MIISEFLPNPVGKDTEGEWIKLFNNSQELINLYQWKIQDASGKSFIFSGDFFLKSKEYLLLDYKTTKIALNNNGEKLFLYDKEGNLIDKAEFNGSAIEGKSLIRQNDGKFIFSEELIIEVSDKINSFSEKKESLSLSASLSDVSNNYLSKKEINPGVFLIGFFLALFLSLVFVIIFKKTNLLLE
ncbi:lamin tail domain-containing protein [Candidatus Wolfebacteria bacterium]|nr:lamin tail domain-containing protein [Candidatus Wolfebacteria bacterium]